MAVGGGVDHEFAAGAGGTGVVEYVVGRTEPAEGEVFVAVEEFAACGGFGEDGFVLCRTVGFQEVARGDEVFARGGEGHAAVVVALGHVGHGVGALAFGIDGDAGEAVADEAEAEGVGGGGFGEYLHDDFLAAHGELELLVGAGYAVDEEAVVLDAAEVNLSFHETRGFEGEAQEGEGGPGGAAVGDGLALADDGGGRLPARGGGLHHGGVFAEDFLAVEGFAFHVEGVGGVVLDDGVGAFVLHVAYLNGVRGGKCRREEQEGG